MEIQELKTFAAIAQYNSFSKAAQTMGYSQSALTVQIHNLEKELGVQLFDRLGKTVILTNHGETFLNYVLNILNSIDEAKDKLNQNKLPGGTLRIGTIDSLCSSVFPGILRSYRERYPDVSICVTTDTPNALFEMLNTNQIDILYIVDEEIHDTRFSKVLNEAEPVCFAATADHPVFTELPKSWSDFLKYSFFLTEKDASYRKVLEYKLGLMNLSIEATFESNSSDLLLSMLKNQAGIIFLPEYALREYLEKNILKKLLIPDFEVVVYRQLLYHKNKWISRELQLFIDLILETENSFMLGENRYKSFI